MKIGIVNYSIGNVGSVYSAFKFYNYQVALIDNAKYLSSVDLIVLAGVGNFPTAASRLKTLNLWDVLDELVLVKKKPVLGICLGMQLFASLGYENGEHQGLDWIPGKVIKLEGRRLKVPHIGWNEVMPREESLFKASRYSFYYFMHSYHFVPDDKKVIIATTRYGDLEICSAVKKDNIVGVQFHPEKSQGDGLRFLKNAVEVLL
jgi:glutamine amidotransferase